MEDEGEVFRKGNMLLGPDEMEGEYAREKIRKEVSLSILSKLTLFHFLSAIVRKPQPLPSNKFMTILVSKSDNLSTILGHHLQPKIPQTSATSICTRSMEPMSPVGLGQNSPIAQDAASPMITRRPLATTWSEHIR